MRVPVLSKTTVEILEAISSEAVFRKTIPCDAPLPVATNSATGVARPRAHGQAITSKATAARIESWRGLPSASQVARVAIESSITMGTKTLLMRSANFWIGAFSPCAVKTILVMRANSVSFPTRRAWITSRPFLLIAPAITSAPGATSIGSDSPVRRELSIELTPSTITPSVGMRSPGRTTQSSPI